MVLTVGLNQIEEMVRVEYGLNRYYVHEFSPGPGVTCKDWD